MKKIILLLSITVHGLVAQVVTPPRSTEFTDAFHEGSQHISAGYGVPNLYKYILKTQAENSHSFNNSFNGANPNENWSYTTSGKGPLFLKYEYAIMDHIGIGVVCGYFDAGLREEHTFQDQNFNSQTGQLTTSSYSEVLKIDITSLSVGARFNYHFGNKEKIDPYLGFGAGYTKATFDVSYESTAPSGTQRIVATTNEPVPIYFGFTFGLRGYLSEQVGLYAEVGLDKWAVFQGGLVIKIN